MRTSKLSLVTAALALGGLTFAAAAPIFQAPSPATNEHRLIMKGVGEFAGTITMHVPATMELPCTEVVTAVGDLWTTSRFEMEMMGMPFSGASTFGYDTRANKYVGTWVDSSNTTMSLMEGQWDEAKQAVVMEYDMYDAMTDSTKRMRSESRQEGDSSSMKFFHVDGETATLEMEINMQRKASKATEAGAKR